MELFCEAEDVARAVDIFRQAGRTGRTDAGWVYVSDVEQVFAIGEPKQEP
jgi:nitrogen regulatory protein P-II 1